MATGNVALRATGVAPRGAWSAGDQESVPSADRPLVEAFVRDGSEDAFATLYRRHQPRLRAIVLRLTRGDPVLADDVLQETWVQAMRGLPRFRWEASLASWLTSIAVNRMRMRWRQRDTFHENAVELESVAAPAGVPSSDMVDVRCAIAQLPSGYRTVLVLYAVLGYTHREIAHRLDISEGTSKSQLSRARHALRSLLHGGTDPVPH